MQPWFIVIETKNTCTITKLTLLVADKASLKVII